MNWSARQYALFEDERTRPVRDLLAALPAMPERRLDLIDLGCGPGNSTEALAARFPGAALRGVDSSAEMLETARLRLPGVRFDLVDIAAWVGRSAAEAAVESFDVIFANAVLQWLPGHRTLFPALAARLRAIGARPPIAAAESYYGWLTAVGCSVDVWRTVYHHPLAGGVAAVVEWFKGSGLRPYLAALDEDQREEFLARYERELARVHPPAADGTVLLPFPRLFVVACA